MAPKLQSVSQLRPHQCCIEQDNYLPCLICTRLLIYSHPVHLLAVPLSDYKIITSWKCKAINQCKSTQTRTIIWKLCLCIPGQNLIHALKAAGKYSLQAENYHKGFAELGMGLLLHFLFLQLLVFVSFKLLYAATYHIHK